MRRQLTVMAVAVLLGACSWPMSGHGPDRRGWSPDDTIITPANVHNLVDGWGAPIIGHEIVADGNVVVTTAGNVVALDRDTGVIRWQAGFGDAAMQGGVVTAMFGCTVERIDVASGAVLAQVDVGGPIVRPPVGISTCDPSGSILRLADRFLVSWAYNAGSLQMAVHCPSPWTTDRRVGSFDDQLRLLGNRSDARGGCSAPSSDEFTRPGFGPVTKTAHGYVMTLAEQLEQLSTGCELCTTNWSTPVTAPVGPAVALVNGSDAIVDGTGTVTVVDDATGATRWTGATGLDHPQPVAADDATVFVLGHVPNTTHGALFAFAAGGCGHATCSPTWSAQLSDGSPAAPSIGGAVLYFATLGQAPSLIAFDAHGCGAATSAPLTTKPLQANATGRTAIVLGRVIVPTVDGIQTFQLPS